ncbi:MAG: hypothetical protein U0X73_16545 [Thermoanaerobaculia bacterium]
MEIVERIEAFVRARLHSVDDFERLALEAFAYQFERLAPYRELCSRAGRTPSTVETWAEIPAIPAAAFAEFELATAPPREVFRSSGTTGTRRSVHHHPFPGLYRATVDAALPLFCPLAAARPPILALVAPRDVVADSSLGFMAAHVLERFGGVGSDYAFGARGVELGKARSWLGARQRESRPAMIFATAFALADLVDFLARMKLHFRLPAGSVIFETGGFKGRTKEIPRQELIARAGTWLGVPPSGILSEYGMTELTSQCYTRALAGDASGRFAPPAWVRVRALAPDTLAELPEGETGLLAIFDLANVGSALHLLTKDLGAIESREFRLAGRAADADLRGCSLAVEEMSAGS